VKEFVLVEAMVRVLPVVFPLALNAMIFVLSVLSSIFKTLEVSIIPVKVGANL
jgi:hypothetical protein